MRSTTPIPRRGALPRPRRRINPKLLHTVYATGRPLWQMAYEAGFLYPSRFSMLIHAEEVPDTEFNVECLERIADVVGFDRSQLFLDAGR